MAAPEKSGESRVEYAYEATTAKGHTVRGIFRGTRTQLAAEARSRGLVITKVKERKNRLKRGRFGPKEFESGIQELHYLLDSGMKIDQGLKLIARNATTAATAGFWSDVAAEIKGGRQFSDGLARVGEQVGFPIPAFYVSILGVGEEVGELASSLGKLYGYLEFRRGLVSEIKSSLAYPAFLIVVTVLAVALIFGVVIPRFLEIFTPEEIAKLPAISRLVFQTGALFQEHAGLVAAALGGGLILAAYGFDTIKARAMDLVYTLPWTQALVLKLELANVLSSLGVMLSGGMDVSRALSQCARVASMPALKALMEESVSEVKKGRRISDVWGESELVPMDVVSLIMVGENSARLGHIATELGARYFAQFKEAMKRALSLLEPGIVLLMGVFVGFVVTAIALGLVSLNDVVQ